MPRQHRNNAAEWVMVTVLTPFAWILRNRKKRRADQTTTAKPKPVRKPVMIEGLPPRTMN